MRLVRLIRLSIKVYTQKHSISMSSIRGGNAVSHGIFTTHPLLSTALPISHARFPNLAASTIMCTSEIGISKYDGVHGLLFTNSTRHGIASAHTAQNTRRLYTPLTRWICATPNLSEKIPAIGHSLHSEHDGSGTLSMHLKRSVHAIKRA